MVTVLIDSRSTEAKKMLDFLKSTRYAKVLDEKEPNEETLLAMREVEKGMTVSYQSSKELMNILKQKAGV
jgi:hypothetical protein